MLMTTFFLHEKTFLENEAIISNHYCEVGANDNIETSRASCVTLPYCYRQYIPFLLQLTELNSYSRIYKPNLN